MGFPSHLTLSGGKRNHSGDRPLNADAVAVKHFATAGTVAAAVLDGKGRQPRDGTAQGQYLDILQ